ncbi:MAG: hypothetical protein AAFY97_01625 [Pseudomonadota bacterium]
MDIRIVMGVVVVLFAIAAFFSSGDQSINIIEKLNNATAPAEAEMEMEAGAEADASDS